MLQDPLLKLNIDLSNEGAKKIVTKAVRERYDKTKPCHLTNSQIKVAVRNVLPDLLIAAFRGEGGNSDNVNETMEADKNRIIEILKTIGVKDEDLEQEFQNLKTNPPTTCQEASRNLTHIEDGVLKEAVQSRDVDSTNNIKLQSTY